MDTLFSWYPIHEYLSLSEFITNSKEEKKILYFIISDFKSIRF